MAVTTYTDVFGRANVAKLSADPTLWTGVLDGKGLSIRSNKLLSTWQDDLGGFHNADAALDVPTDFAEMDETLLTERQSGSLTFKSSERVSMDETTIVAPSTDDFNRANSASNAVGTNWVVQPSSGTDAFDILSNKLRTKNVGSDRSMMRTTLIANCADQFSQIEFRAVSHVHDDSWNLPLRFGVGVRADGDTTGSFSYDLTVISQNSTTHNYEIVYENAGSKIVLQSGSLNSLMAAGDVFKLVATETGPGLDLKAYQNGVQLGTTHAVPRTVSAPTVPTYIASGRPTVSMPIYTGVDTGYFDLDNWEGGEIFAVAASASQVSTEMEFFNGAHGVGYSENEDSPSSHSYSPKAYVFTDADYLEVDAELVEGDILSGEIELVDATACNVVAKINNVEVARIDGATRFYGPPAIRGSGSSPEQITYVDGLQARSEQVWSSVTLTAETLDPVQNETNRTSLAACVRTKQDAAWGKWKFSGTLRAYSVIDSVLVLSIERGNTVFVETIDISPVPGTRFLDCEILSADMDTPVLDTDVTTWTLPGDFPEDPDYPLVIFNLDTGELIEILDRTYMTKVSATGDFTGTNVAIGLLYPTQWELTPLFVTTQENDGATIALTDGRLQIRHVEFNFTATGEFTVTVIPNTDDPSQSYEYTYDGADDAEKGTFRVPVLGQNTKARITVGGTSHRPFAISNFSWTGYLSQITKRV